jgi:hypothetical protein
MSSNVYAYTALGDYPEYISVNVNEDSTVEITVRSPRKADGSCGDTATAKLSGEEFAKFASRIYAFACTNGA